MTDASSMRDIVRGGVEMPTRPIEVVLNALDDERLTLWGRWEQANFGLYKLQTMKRGGLSVDAEPLRMRLLDDLGEIERQLGLPSCPHAPFAQGRLY